MSEPHVELFVNGTLMRGLPLHANLGGAPLLGEHVTVPAYRLYAVGTAHPAMLRDDADGVAVAGELYRLTLEQLAAVLDGEPAGLGIGVVELDGPGRRLGVLWTGGPLPANAADISDLGGWRAYLAAIETNDAQEASA